MNAVVGCKIAIACDDRIVGPRRILLGNDVLAVSPEKAVGAIEIVVDPYIKRMGVVRNRGLELIVGSGKLPWLALQSNRTGDVGGGENRNQLLSRTIDAG